MKPTRFAFRRALSIAEAINYLARYDGEAKILAGGQSLVPLLNMRLARPAALVDINAVPGLDQIRAADGALELGALVRHTDLARSPEVGARAPLLAAAAAHVGHRAIRNRGTLGGSIAHADPAAELAAAAVALQAELSIEGPSGARAAPAEQFFVTLFTTDLQPDEILTAVRISAADGAAWGFAELARRPGDFAIAGIAALLHPDPSDPSRAASVRLVGFGVGDRPVRLESAEQVLAGAAIDAALARQAGEATAEDVDPPDDLHASGAYRRHLTAVLTERAVLDAAARAVGRPIPSEQRRDIATGTQGRNR
jgi:carbon-monoxide dehydrogenase medium subunit